MPSAHTRCTQTATKIGCLDGNYAPSALAFAKRACAVQARQWAGGCDELILSFNIFLAVRQRALVFARMRMKHWAWWPICVLMLASVVRFCGDTFEGRVPDVWVAIGGNVCGIATLLFIGGAMREKSEAPKP